MRLIKVLERQTGYLIFIRSNHVSFYKVQCAIFAKQFSILILHYHALFQTFSRSGNAFTKFPTFSRLFPIVGTLFNMKRDSTLKYYYLSDGKVFCTSVGVKNTNGSSLKPRIQRLFFLGGCLKVFKASG